MADSSDVVRHIEKFVDTSASPSQQDASVGAIAVLLKTDMLTLASLVKEMDLYLTTSDSIIRARAILLLAEVLTRLASKTFDDATRHSLIRFFTERLADWKALRGALVGCLALMKRKSGVGSITNNEARTVVQSFMQNLSVQSLGRHDRKLCFELLICVLDRYPDVAVDMGDELVYVISEAIDGEKDPECLVLKFHLVEILALLFPDSSGPLASVASELFDHLGSYFPIHFTHPKGEDDADKDMLSQALMMAFASTPLFEPFAIPLLLEKLSSSLPLAKLESLKYLSYCMEKYGAHRMSKHVKSLWSELKGAIFTSELAASFFELEPRNGLGSQDNKVSTEALMLLQKTIRQNTYFCLQLVLNDEDINTQIDSLASFRSFEDIPSDNKQKLLAVGCILNVSAQTSSDSCNMVFESFFPRFINGFGSEFQNQTAHTHADEGYAISARPNFGYLYLCVALLAATRTLVVGSDESGSVTVCGHHTWCSTIQSFSALLIDVFKSALIADADESSQKEYIQVGVKGLQILAMFPGSFSPASNSTFEKILVQLMSLITEKFNNAFLWKLVLKALVEIGLFVDKFHDSEKKPSFDVIVVESMVHLLCSNDVAPPLSLKVEAISDIGMTGLNFMKKVLEGLNKATSTHLSEFCVHGDSKSAESAANLLQCYCDKVSEPWKLRRSAITFSGKCLGRNEKSHVFYQ